MRTSLDELKATQAAAFFLRSAPGRRFSKFRKLVRLMYLSDREALVRLGYTITHGKHCSLPDGPVISEINDLLSGSHYKHRYSEQGYWSKHIVCTQEKGVELVKDPGTGRLGASHIRILEEIAHNYGEMTDHELGDVTHDLPEYNPPEGRRKSSPINPATTLQYSDFADEHVQGIVRENEAYDFFHRLVQR